MNTTTKTTCGQHRTMGYAFTMAGALTCRGCGEPQSRHETFDETIARRRSTEES